VYRLAIKEKLDRKFKKLQKKDKEMLRLIDLSALNFELINYLMT